MENKKAIEWILRIAFFGIFIGHGILALQGKTHFIDMFVGMAKLVGWAVPAAAAASFVFVIGIIDTSAALLMLWRPMRFLLVGGALWAFATALARPLATHGWNFGAAFDPNSDGWMDFVERAGNFLVPLALLYIRGFPKKWKDWWD